MKFKILFVSALSILFLSSEGQVKDVFCSFNAITGTYEFHYNSIVIQKDPNTGTDTGNYRRIGDTIIVQLNNKVWSERKIVVLDSLTYLLCEEKLRDTNYSIHWTDTLYKTIEYYKNGQIGTKGSYSNFYKEIFFIRIKPIKDFPITKHGKWEFFSEDGKKIKEIKYRFGNIKRITVANTGFKLCQ